MSNRKFVIQEGHFHIADKGCYVLTGWFADADTNADADSFRVFLDRKRLAVRLRVFSDESVRQKYAKYDLDVAKEYVILIKLPAQLSGYRRLSLCLADGSRIYERSVTQLQKMQKQLNYRITNIQITGADCVVNGWVASKKPIKINVFDRAKEPVQCEVTHFPKPDVALEYREAQDLADGGFSVTVPMNGRKKLYLQITDGESSVIRQFSAVDKNRITMYLKKAHYYMKRNGLKKTCKRAVNEAYELVGDTGNYMKWRKKNMASARELEKQRQDTGGLRPLLYVVTPYQDSHHFTWTAISMKNQTYSNWKWVIACTASEKSKVKERLHAYVQESRILYVPVDGHAGYQQRIALAVAKAAEQMQGQPGHWMAFLGPYDTLEPDAFYDCVKMWEAQPDMDMCYTDEDQVTEDGKDYREPVFKSDFNIDMLRATNYLGHMVLLRGDLVSRLDGWESAYGTAASYDYYLRASELAVHIGHLQRVVYHSRENNRQVHDTAKPVLDAHYKRLGIPAVVQMSGTEGIYHTQYQWEETPMVSVNIPNKDHIDDLDTCVQSVLKNCKYPNYEIVIIENNSTQESTFAYYKKIQEQDARVRVIYWKEEFNFSRITNFGVAHSDGDYILLLNNDTEVISPDFMEEMLGYCMREDVGICGARLFYFDDTIQHAGVIIGLGGICGEGFQGFPKENGGYQNRIFCPQDYSAVTAACLMTRKSVFEEAGGMDGEFQVAYNDIDYCLKVRALGKLVVYNPFAMLHHYEYKSRGTEDTPAKLARYNREVDLFTTRWVEIISAGDPYYNPNLTRRYQDFSLRRIELLK